MAHRKKNKEQIEKRPKEKKNKHLKEKRMERTISQE